VYSTRIYKEKGISSAKDIYKPALKRQEIISVKCSSCIEGVTLKQSTVKSFSFHFKGDLTNETFPHSEEFFKEYQELTLFDTSKKFTINDGDFSHCPEKYYNSLMYLLNDFRDRFIESVYDFRLNDPYPPGAHIDYEAEIETMEGKLLCEKAKRIPTSKFENVLAVVKQWEHLGIVSASDSAWRSNLVLTPRTDEKSSRFRVGLDFKELNNILVCPKDVKFATLDELQNKLKGKVVVRLDLSATSLMIPIREEHRYKTSFWLNDLSYGFNVLVKSIKSSYFHIQKLFDEKFSEEMYFEFAAKLSADERKLLPGSFNDIIITSIPVV
jgi:hypothetical protein